MSFLYDEIVDGWLGLFQLWLVLHIYSRICLLVSDLSVRLHKQANGEPMENLCQAFCCAYGVSWPNKGIFGFSELPCTNHVQIHKGKSQKGTKSPLNCVNLEYLNVMRINFVTSGSSSDDHGFLHTRSKKEISSSWICICCSSGDWLDHVHTGRCTNITQFQCHWCSHDIWCFDHGLLLGKSARSNLYLKPSDHTGDLISVIFHTLMPSICDYLVA